ncbi:MAG: HNH endonuclease signature motif containing protein [Micropruina sp.]|uniref:HNH endonuclease n=1 Tax=Micropruina sp. TaxID=2737536 RepID=UPI0039E5967B
MAAGGAPCWRCGRVIHPSASWDVDHIVPREQGGSNDPGNLAPCHSRCNRRAGGVVGVKFAQAANAARKRGENVTKGAKVFESGMQPTVPDHSVSLSGLPAGLPAVPPDDLPTVTAVPLVLSEIPAGTDLAEAHAGARWLGLPLTPQGEQIAGVMQALGKDGHPLYETVVAEAPGAPPRPRRPWQPSWAAA